MSTPLENCRTQEKKDFKIKPKKKKERETNYQQISVISTHCNTEHRSQWNDNCKGLRKNLLTWNCTSNKTIIQEQKQNKDVFK